MITLYLETNFLMCLATGRDPNAEKLLSRDVDLAIPAVCFMEALKAMKPVRARSGELRKAIERELEEVQKDRARPEAMNLIAALTEARVRLDEYLNDVVELRFRNGVLNVARHARVIPFSIDAAAGCFRDRITNGDADNLILHTVFLDAQARPSHAKAFLSENARDFGAPSARQTLKTFGVEYKSKVADAISWLDSQERKAPSGPPT